MSYNSKYKGSEVEELLDSIGNKVDKVDGKQLSTEDFTTLLKQKLEGLSNYDDTAIQASVSKLRTDLDTLVSGDTTTAIKTFNEVIDFLEGLKDTEDLASIIASIEQQIAAKQDAITDLATIREGAALGATSLQEESFKGTVTSITAGEGLTGGTITESGTISLEDLLSRNTSITFYSFDKTGIFVGSNLSLNKTSKIDYVYPYSIVCDKYGRITELKRLGSSIARTHYNVNEATTSLAGFMTAADKTKLDGIDMTTKQDTLVSGTNIKTINGESILGSGNIVIEGGSGGTSSGGSGAYAEVNHGTSDTTFTLTPNTFHVWDEVASLDLSFGAETSGVANEYLFQFTSGATATTLTLPSDIKWANEPTIAENKIYQISVLKGLGSVLEFSNNTSVFPIILNVNTTTDEGKLAYQELEKIGESGTLDEGLLVINGINSVTLSVTSFSYDASRSAYNVYVQGMTQYFLNADGYCFTAIVD